MTLPLDRQRKSKSELWWYGPIVGLFAVFLFLAIYHKFFASRIVTDDTELKVLESAPLDERRGTSTDWPQWRGPHRDGISPEKGLLTEWPDAGPKELWRRPSGAGYSSLAVADGRVVTMARDGDLEAVICWNAANGKELWRHRYPCSTEGIDWGSGPRSTPTIEGDYVYTVGVSGILKCLKLRPASPKGEEVWSVDLLKEFAGPVPTWGFSFSPLIDGDLLFTNPGAPEARSLVAFDKRTGKIVWQNLDDRGGYSSPITASFAGKKQVVFFTAQGLVGVVPESGKLLWRFPWETSYDCNIATPIALGNYIFISSGYNRGCAVVRIDEAANGAWEARRVYEHNKMCNHFATCVLYDGHLYGFSDPSLLTCMDFRTGKIRWKERGFDKGSLMIADGHLIILGERGKLAIAEATHQEYREKAAFQVSNNQTWTVPVLANGRLYVRDEENVICLDVRKK